jgi:Ni/Fe-hydrogenase subunit HybB-like protein
MHVLALLVGFFLLICIISMDIGFPACSFCFHFHTITRLHELDGLLILMGMNNRSISWGIWSKLFHFFICQFLGCWLARCPYLMFLLMGYWRKKEMRRTQ